MQQLPTTCLPPSGPGSRTEASGIACLTGHGPSFDPASFLAMATILLVGVDLFFRGKLEGLLPEHQLVTKDSAQPPDLVVCDIARIDPMDVADNWPDVPILGYTNHTDTAGLRAGNAAGFDQVDRQVGARGAGARARGRADG